MNTCQCRETGLLYNGTGWEDCPSHVKERQENLELGKRIDQKATETGSK